jgi:hypothetical protein
MTIDLEVLGEMWLTTKEYIAVKDRQAAADHVVSVVADHNILERDLKAFGATDSYLGRAVHEYLGEDDSDNADDVPDSDEEY